MPSPPDFGLESLRQRRIPRDGPRLYAKTRHVWIYPTADATQQWIGFLWTGGSVRLKSEKPVMGVGCAQFYAILPRGYVCGDGQRITLDPDDPVLVALYPFSPITDSPWPHRYGESRGTPRYVSLPSEPVQRAQEPGLSAHLARVQRARDEHVIPTELVGVDLAPSPEADLTLPSLLPSVHEPYSSLRNRSTIAYSAEVRHQGRDFLLTSDYEWVPKDRISVYPVTRFHGVHLDGQTRLPIALFRTSTAERYRRSASGDFEPTEERFPLHGWVSLTDQSEHHAGQTYIQTAVGDWLRQDQAVVPTATLFPSATDRPDHLEASDAGNGARHTSIEISVHGGWLIAYEGDRPVFTTLISPGRGGTPSPGHEPIETGATPTGRFVITGKFVTATMAAPNEYLHWDVPYAQNFSGPYALHTAYWHDNWGHLMSGGCVNLSPIDGYFLFHWTEPEIPDGWYGVRWLPHLGPATQVVIHR